MKFKKINGQVSNIAIDKYKIDWDAPSPSKGQFEVKQFLRPLWERCAVYEEVVLAGTKLRLDFFNRNKMIGIEYDGVQHQKFNKFFMGNSRSNYVKHQMRDKKKEELLELNGIFLIRLIPDDLKNLSKQWFREKWDIEI